MGYGAGRQPPHVIGEVWRGVSAPPHNQTLDVDDRLDFSVGWCGLAWRGVGDKYEENMRKLEQYKKTSTKYQEFLYYMGPGSF